jgi:curved DNA-binding protein CbpA
MSNKGSQESFSDYYEILQVSQNADIATIERVYRFLAKRYHPDNIDTGDSDTFRVLLEAYKTLSDPEKRAGYDARYEQVRARQWKILDEQVALEGVDEDKRIQNGILSFLYSARRRDPMSPGIGVVALERLLNCPQQHMEFHAWYLREKGWIQRTDNGEFAITASGVDAVLENDLLPGKHRLLTAGENKSEDSEDSKDPNT